MMIRSLPFALALAIVLGGAPAGTAQTGVDSGEAGENAGRIPSWKAELPGGRYMIALRAIQAISSQQYIVDNAARVTEVNITTSGVFQPRFYYIEPLAVETPSGVPQSALDRAQSTATEVAARTSTGDPVWMKVSKSYPTTTHAGTIEYRLETKEQLEKLMESLERAWTTGRGEVYRVKAAGESEEN